MSRTRVIIPFRDRGRDLRRAANLQVVHAWWLFHGFEVNVVSDGRDGDEQFNRHRAYNRAVAAFPETDVFVFAEADMLIHPSQILDAVHMAHSGVGLVVPFTAYHYLSDATTTELRDGYHDHPNEETVHRWSAPVGHPDSPFTLVPESVMLDGKSIGAVNVVSRHTLDLTGGFTEATHGNWYDDRIIEEGFAFLTAPTRFVPGPAVHLYHLPGWTGEHLTDADRSATALNRSLLAATRRSIRNNDREAVLRTMRARSIR